ncbi:MAG TPA: hypothetical protein DD490_24515 [Acidobacteria bacterium]|nr:hypothetical protein [Acidobacteriota bacterium]
MAANLPGASQDDNNEIDVFLHDRVSGDITLVSHASSGTSTTGNGRSDDPILSTDGSVVVFTSRATNLLPDPVGGGVQLFLYDRRNRRATLISHAATSPSSGVLGGILGGGHHSVSGDGRWVAFASKADDLIAGQVEANAGGDVFLFDRATGANTLVSHAGFSSTQTGNGPSTAPAISGDGRYIAFESSASDLAAGQTGAGSIFVYDRVAGITTRVSASGGNPLAISADGRQVVFTGGSNVYLWDRVLATTRLVSRSLASPTTPGNGPSSLGTSDNPQVLSADGRWVVFASTATDLVPGQAGGHPGIFLFDRISGTVSQVSAWAGSLTTSQPALSGDGRFVAYGSEAHDLVPGQVDSIGSPDFFRFDREAGTTSLISHVPASAVTTGKALSDATLEGPRLSADGAWSTFASLSPDLVPGDRDGTKDAFLDANLLPGRDFYTVSPCRLIDTRKGPALVSGGRSVLPAHDLCSIPATARAVAANVTVIQPSGAGYLTFHAGDSGPETTSTLTFAAGQLRSNNAIIPLAFDGTGTFAVTPLVAGNGSVHLTVDVSGWFE